MANIDLKAATPAASISDTGFLFGAESQGDAAPKVYQVAAIKELIRDTIGAALVAGTNITVTVDDAGDTITIAGLSDAAIDERARDALGAALVAGTGISITPNDGSDTITIAATGGGGGSTNHEAQGYPSGNNALTREEYFWKLGKGINASTPATANMSASLGLYVDGGASIARPNTTSERIRLANGSTSGAARAQYSGTAVRALSASGRTFGLKARVAFNPTGVAPIGVAEYWASVGFQLADSNKESTTFLAFQYHHNGTGVEFAARRRINSGSITTTPLTYPGDNVEVTLEIVITETEIRFYQDGVLVLTDTTNLPTAALREQVMVGRTTGTSNGAIDVLWMAAFATGMVQ